MVPGSAYDRSGQMANNNGGMASYIPRAAANMGDPYSRMHDPIGYIAPERAQAVAALPAMPVPIGVFMNMTHVPPRFNNQPPPNKSNSRGRDHNSGRSGPPRSGKGKGSGSSLLTQPISQSTQDVASQSFSQSGMALTQGMSQVSHRYLFQIEQKLINTFFFVSLRACLRQHQVSAHCHSLVCLNWIRRKTLTCRQSTSLKWTDYCRKIPPIKEVDQLSNVKDRNSHR